MMTVEVKNWKYSRPPHIPEDVKEVVYPCGCKEYDEDGVWYGKRCIEHQNEINALIKRLRGKETT